MRRRIAGSLRRRITFWYGGLLVLCLLAFSVTVGLRYATHVSAELDRRVHEDIELAARALVVAPDGTVSWSGGLLGKAVDEEEGGGHWVEVWSPNGTRLLGTGTIDGSALGPIAADERAGRPRSMRLPSGPVRVQTEVIRVNGRDLVLRAALSEAATRRQNQALWTQLLLVTLAVVAIGGYGGALLARRSLAPLDRMVQHARRITAEQLHERLSPEDWGEELNQLRDAFNGTLARLESSFGQLRRFTADASHEIRTPLTALRTVGEVGLRAGRSAEEYREVIGTMLEEVDRLSRLADELLTLSRAEAGQAHLRNDDVDLSVLASEVAASLAVLAEEREQALETDVDGPLLVTGDRAALRQALLNLVDNAIKYAPERTKVLVRARADAAGSAVLEVSDEGPGIPPEHRDKVFERFYRVDRGRSREMGGTGLGLSLVKWTVEAHGGKVAHLAREPRGSTFRIILPPRAPAGAPVSES